MMRALLHLPRSNTHSSNVKQSSHLGLTWVKIQNLQKMPQLGHNSSKLCTQRKWKRQKREEEPRGSRWQVHLQETAEKGRAGDQNITYIVIDSDHEKSSEEDEVSITVICIKKFR